MLNELLPAYHFIDFIAQGGMGAVYRAKQISLDREVAVKILPRELSADPEFRVSFQTEARAMARLNHPNLIAIYDSGDVDGMLYIAMEYVPGKSLYHSAWNAKIDREEASRIVIGICEGLSHAHENGIIHRDIKPANILLTPKAEPKIGDFGLAQAVGVKHEGIVMGTPGYSAPEVLTHPERADRRSDLFAVGVILHELLTAVKPEPNVLASSLCNCGPEFDLVIQRATHPNPIMRYPDANAMVAAIREALKSPSQKSARSLTPSSRPLAGKMPKAAPMQKAVVAQKPVLVAAPAREIPEPTSTQAPQALAKAAVAPSAADHDDDNFLPPLDLPSTNSNWPLVRNMLIIAGLLVVLVFVYQKLEIHKETVAKKEHLHNLKVKEEEMRRRAEAEQAAKMPDKPQAIAGNEMGGGNALQNETETTPEEVETPMESLERLQYALSKGERAEMPIGVKRRGDLDFFLVTQEMTWDHAIEFAENHGAHIALPTSEDSLTLLGSMLQNSETIWLGAGLTGRDQWMLLDGSTWSFEKTPPGVGSFATLSYLGNVKAAEGHRKFPFVIAWHRDGSNPSSLAAILQNTKKSLDTAKPVFPPGTMVQDSRYFLPIIRKMTRLEAAELAARSGAHIAALSTKEENYWVKDHMNQFEAEAGIWLAGEKIGGVWTWATKEPWTYADWASKELNDDEEATSMVYLPGKGWHNLSPEDKADGVLLEWSKDGKSQALSQADVNAGIPNVASLITKARELVVAAEKERKANLAANMKDFKWDLEVWVGQLKPLIQAQWKMPVQIIVSICEDDRVPPHQDITSAVEENYDNGDAPAMHPDIIKFHTYNYTKQMEIDAAFLLGCGKIRDFYVIKLKEMGAAAQKAGQQDLVQQLKEYLEEAEDVEQWAESLLEE
jgi:serine/threonine protein kinase